MPFQLALDEILFRGFENNGTAIHPPLLRFYYSSEPWVTVGYSLEREKEGRGMISRRMTGGGRVAHGKDLLFSLIAHKSAEDSFRSVRTSYWKIHEAVKAAFEALGKCPRFYRCDENLPRGSDCFLFPIATDLALGNRKIAGGGQKRSKGALLHQESIQWGSAGDEDFVNHLREGFEKVFQMNMEPFDLDPAWLEEAEELAKEKYSCHDTITTANPTL